MRLPAFLALSATTVAAVAVAAVLVLRQPETAAVTGSGELLFPALVGAANQISEIRIQKGSETTTIVRGDQAWSIRERGDYPASKEKIKQLVVELAQLRRLEAKTDNPERYASIGVEDVGATAGSTAVTVTDAQGQPLAKLLLGETPTTGAATDTHFVRIPGEPRAWLAEGALSADPAVATWIDQTVIDLPADQVAEVKVTRPDGKTLTAVKADAAAPHFALRELPRNRHLKSEDALDGMATALTQLQLQDLVMANQIDFSAASSSHARFRTFDGLIVDVELVQHDGKDWIRLSAAAAPGASAATVAKAEDLNRSTRGYAYNVYTWKVAPLLRSLDELTDAGSGA